MANEVLTLLQYAMIEADFVMETRINARPSYSCMKYRYRSKVLIKQKLLGQRYAPPSMNGAQTHRHVSPLDVIIINILRITRFTLITPIDLFSSPNSFQSNQSLS